MPKTKIKKKEVNDKFYTHPDIAKKYFEIFLNLNLKTDYYLEPSAGNGSFSLLLPSGSIAIDILPESDSIIKADYLTFPINLDNLTIIGNPPFGERNNMAKAFIRKACQEAQTIAFVLPEVFEKSIMQINFSSDFKLVFSEKLDSDSFVLNGLPYNVHSVFHVWTKHEVDLPDLRKPYLKITECEDFYFSKRENSDFFVFGSAPTKCIPPSSVTANNRGYYIKVKEGISTDSVLNIFSNSDWKTVGKSGVSGGVFWLTGQELIEGYLKFKTDNNSEFFLQQNCNISMQ